MGRVAAKTAPRVKPAAKVSAAKDKGKRALGAQSNRALYVAGAGAALLVALLVTAAHTLKRSRKLERQRARACAKLCAANATLCEEAEVCHKPEAPRWVLSERTIATALGVLVGAVLIGSAAIVLSQRLVANLRSRRDAARVRNATAVARKERLAALERAKAAYAEARSRARGADEASRRAQREFEEGLLRQIREVERAAREAAQAELAAEREEIESARREAARIDELTRSLGAGGAGGGGMGAYDDDDDWNMGEFDFDAEAEEGDDAGDDADEDGADGAEGDEGEGGGEADEGGDGLPAASERMNLELDPTAPAARRGARISLDGLGMPSAATARPTSVSVSLGCSKCSHALEVTLSGVRAESSAIRSWCEKCGSLLGAALRPCLLHEANAVYGFVDPTNCAVLDVPRLAVLMACGRCDAELPLPELVRGRTVHAGCRGCHAPLSLHMANVTVERLGPLPGGLVARSAAADAADDDEMEQLLKKLRKRNLDQFKLLGLVVGKPLPNKGACKHYAHSYRWLRYPCCGRAHPCAVCHEASDCPAASLGVWANRMICGKCSREMAYSDSPCAHCGNTFTKPGGAHWQGGAGCRDQQKLAKTDSRKHRGASAAGVKKTTSQKSQRVGAAGKKAAAMKALSHGARG